MRRLLLVPFLLGLLPSVAAAYGWANLSWDDCGSHGSLMQTFACNTNEGSHTLVGSFVAPAGIDSLNGVEVTVDLISSTDPFPSWWKFKQAGTCRQNSMSVSFDFAGWNNCTDYWAGRELGAFTYQLNPTHPNGTPYPDYTRRALLKAVCVVYSEDAGPVAEGAEVYAFRIVIDNARTVGDSACGSCGAGVCISLRSIRLTQNPGSATGAVYLERHSSGPVAWQCKSWWGGPYQPFCVFDPSCPTATRNRTWGQVKSLYR